MMAAAARRLPSPSCGRRAGPAPPAAALPGPAWLRGEQKEPVGLPGLKGQLHQVDINSNESQPLLEVAADPSGSPAEVLAAISAARKGDTKRMELGSCR